MTEIVTIETRNTPWRQGSFISSEGKKLLKLDEQFAYMVISHDCDLAAQTAVEPQVEIIRCKPITNSNGNNVNSKNPRKLHIDAQSNGVAITLEMVQSDKKPMNKDLVWQSTPCTEIQIDEDTIRIVRTWLACRYRRHALPNELNDRLQSVFSKFENAAKKNSDGVIATFLEYDPFNKELPQDEPYEIQIWIVFNSHNSNGQENADAIASAIRAALGSVQSIDCREVAIKSDVEFTLRDLNRMIEWRMEHVSFRGEIVGQMVEP